MASRLDRALHVERHYRNQLLVAHLRQARLRMAGKDLVGELLFACDEIVNTLLHRAPADELVDEHVLLLADAKGAVRCLVLDRRVPPPVEVDNMGRGGQSPVPPAFIDSTMNGTRSSS